MSRPYKTPWYFKVSMTLFALAFGSVLLIFGLAFAGGAGLETETKLQILEFLSLFGIFCVIAGFLVFLFDRRQPKEVHDE